jgi:hypothetical protein
MAEERLIRLTCFSIFSTEGSWSDMIVEAGCKTFKMPILSKIGRGRKERGNQDSSLLRLNRLIALHCPLCEGFVRGTTHATLAFQIREHVVHVISL